MKLIFTLICALSCSVANAGIISGAAAGAVAGSIVASSESKPSGSSPRTDIKVGSKVVACPYNVRRGICQGYDVKPQTYAAYVFQQGFKKIYRTWLVCAPDDPVDCDMFGEVE